MSEMYRQTRYECQHAALISGHVLLHIQTSTRSSICKRIKYCNSHYYPNCYASRPLNAIYSVVLVLNALSSTKFSIIVNAGSGASLRINTEIWEGGTQDSYGLH